MLSLVLFIVSLIAGIGLGRWCLKESFYLGFNDLAYGITTPFTWLAWGFYEIFVSTALFINVFWVNYLIDSLTGGKSDSLYSQLFFSGLAAFILIWAMIIEGVRSRRRYYEGVVPLRRAYRCFPSKLLIRPPFWNLYRMW